MPKPQYSARIHVQATLTQDQILCLLTADEDGDIYGPDPAEVPDWLLIEMEDIGLITAGHCPGAWRLSQGGWDAWRAMLAK